MHRFYVIPENIDTTSITLSPPEAKHAYSVIRLRQHDEVVVFDGKGMEYTGVVDALSPRHGRITIKHRIRHDPPVLNITLAAAIPKQSRFDEMVDNATQLGVHALIPLISERTIVKSEPHPAGHKQQRWQKIAVEAAKQCGCVYVPDVLGVEKFSNIVKRAGDFDLALIPALHPGAVPLKKIIRNRVKPGKIIVFIGPEGDFSPAEVARAQENNCHVVSLGRRVLRCATAASMVLSVLCYEWEN